MRDNQTAERKRAHKLVSKGNRRYSSIQEYFSNLNSCYGVFDNYSKEDLTGYFNNIGIYIKTKADHVKFPYEKTQNMTEFLDVVKELNPPLYSRGLIPHHSFSTDKQGLKFSSNDMNNITGTIASIKVKLVAQLEPYLHKNVFAILCKFLAGERDRLEDTRAWYVMEDIYWVEERLEEHISCAETKEEEDEIREDFAPYERFKNFMYKCEKAKPIKIWRPRYKEHEKRLLKMVAEISSYNYNDIWQFLDLEDFYDSEEFENLGEESGEDYDPENPTEEQINCMKNSCVWQYYSGQYILIWDEDDVLIKDYLEYINSLSNETMWIFNCSSYDEVRNGRIFTPFVEEAKRVVRHNDNYFAINDLLFEIYTMYVKD